MPVTAQAAGSRWGTQRISSTDCLPKTQVSANPQGDVWGLTPARCQTVKGTPVQGGTEALVNGGDNYNRPKVAKFLVG